MHIDHQPGRAQHGPLPPPQVGGLASDLTSLADVVERLFTEFAPHLDLGVVVSTVRRCRRELDIVHGPAIPELVERLTRQRLQTIPTARHGSQGHEDDPRHARGHPLGIGVALLGTGRTFDTGE
jgi:hypothetical protein